MSQDFTADCFAGGHIAETDLEAIENNFAALKTLFAGAGSPGNPVAFMPWGHTTRKCLKMRDRLNATWLGLFHGSTSQKMWVYRDSAMDGYAVDSGVSDKALAIKGGTTYTTGGATAGTWTVDFDHVHQFYRSNVPTGDDKVWDDNGDEISVPSATMSGGTRAVSILPYYSVTLDDAYTLEAAPAAAWRLAAAVGTLQYLDL